jgi:hypothetical protein
MMKFDYKGFHTAKYLDPESRRVAEGTWAIANTLTSNLITEGKINQAHNFLIKNIKELPLKNSSVDDTLSRFQTIQHLYSLNETKEANKLASDTFSFLDQEMRYITSLEPKRMNSYGRDLQIGMYVLDNLYKMTASYGQHELSKKIKIRFKELEEKFS